MSNPTAEKRLALALIVLVLSGCEAQKPPETKTKNDLTYIFYETPKLTPAPPGETLLERWKRTKADYDAASKVADHVRDLSYKISGDALHAYMDAEKALNEAQCSKVCIPENSK